MQDQEWMNISLMLRNSELEYVKQGLAFWEYGFPHFDDFIQGCYRQAAEKNNHPKTPQELFDFDRLASLFQEYYHKNYIAIWVLGALASFEELAASRSTLLYLDLSGKRLRELPDNIGNVASLRILDLSNNQLQSLPDICALTNMEWLDLSQNNLDELPDSVGCLTRLEWLDLADNYIRRIPTGCAQLDRLTSINLRGCPMKSRPAELESLPNLQQVVL